MVAAGTTKTRFLESGDKGTKNRYNAIDSSPIGSGLDGSPTAFSDQEAPMKPPKKPAVGDRMGDWIVVTVTPNLTPYRRPGQETKIESYTLGLRHDPLQIN